MEGYMRHLFLHISINFANWSHYPEVTKLPDICRRDWGVWDHQERLLQRLLVEDWLVEQQPPFLLTVFTESRVCGLRASRRSSTGGTLCSVVLYFTMPSVHKGAAFFYFLQGKQLLQTDLPHCSSIIVFAISLSPSSQNCSCGQNWEICCK